MSPRPIAAAAEAEPEVRLALLERGLDDLRHQLFGNGQPGMLQLMEAKIDKLDAKVGKLMLIVVGLAGGSGYGAAKLVEWLAG